MEEEEAAVFSLARIAGVEFVDELNSEVDEGIGVVFAGAGDGVGQVGEQGEVEIGIGVGETANLELLDELAHLGFVEEQGGNGDHAGVVGGDAVGEVDFGQREGAEDGGDGVVDEVDCALCGGNEEEQKRQGEAAEDGVVGYEGQKHGADEDDGEDLDAADVEVVGVAVQR